MGRFGEGIDDEIRFLYICDIVDGLGRARLSFPTANQEKLYDDALRHVCRLLISNHREEASTHTTTCGSPCSMKKKKRSRKEVLKEILSLLVCLQCERLYDPPADDEIGYYFLIKRYIRSIMAFFVSGPDIGMILGGSDEKLHCYEVIGKLHHMEELSELNQHLADLAVFVSDADFRNGSSVTPLMGINEKIEVHSFIEGSKERRNAFYFNKFQLAKFDLRSSEFAHCPPLEEEKRLYVHILDDMPSASSIAVQESEPNVFSDLLCSLFVERTEREIKDLERHCRRIKDLILDKLSLTERYELIHEQFKLLVETYHQNYVPREDPEEDPEEIDLTDFKRELVQKCKVSAKELTNYVRCVHQYQRIAVNVAVFVISRLSDDHTLCCDVYSLLKYDYNRKAIGWQLLHSLTILKQGRFFFGTVLQEHSIVRISKKRARGEFQQEAMWMQKCGTQKAKNENLKILREIVEDLRCIGVSDIETDDEEDQLVHKIWWNVASSIQFFLSTIAYEQRHHISKCGGLPDEHLGRVLDLRGKLYQYQYDISDISDLCKYIPLYQLDDQSREGLA